MQKADDNTASIDRSYEVYGTLTYFLCLEISHRFDFRSFCVNYFQGYEVNDAINRSFDSEQKEYYIFRLSVCVSKYVCQRVRYFYELSGQRVWTPTRLFLLIMTFELLPIYFIISSFIFRCNGTISIFYQEGRMWSKGCKIHTSYNSIPHSIATHFVAGVGI